MAIRVIATTFSGMPEEHPNSVPKSITSADRTPRTISDPPRHSQPPRYPIFLQYQRIFTFFL